MDPKVSWLETQVDIVWNCHELKFLRSTSCAALESRFVSVFECLKKDNEEVAECHGVSMPGDSTQRDGWWCHAEVRTCAPAGTGSWWIFMDPRNTWREIREIREILARGQADGPWIDSCWFCASRFGRWCQLYNSRWSCQNILVHISECLTSMMPINLVMQNWWRIQKRQCDSYVNPQCIPRVVLASWSILVHACNPWSSCLDHLDPFARCKADEVVQDVVKRIQSGAQRCVAREPILLLLSEVDVWCFTIFSLPKVSGQSS